MPERVVKLPDIGEGVAEDGIGALGFFRTKVGGPARGIGNISHHAFGFCNLVLRHFFPKPLKFSFFLA